MKKSVGQKKSKSSKKTVSKVLNNVDVQQLVVSNPSTNKRSSSVDLLRALAIVFMVLTHVTAIAFSFEGGKVLQSLSLAGGTLCFTFFILLSGVSSYFSFIRKTDPEEIMHKKHSLFVRTIQILIAYYFVASFSMYALKLGFFGSPSAEWIRDFLRIAAFQKFPDFTEFIIPFFAFVFISIFTKRLLDKITQSLISTTIAAIISYLLGAVLYTFEFDYEPLNYIKGVFTGFLDIHTFPLLQYFGMFLVGIYIGKTLVKSGSIFSKFKQIGILGVASGIFYGIAAFFTFGSSQQSSTILNASVYEGRFPPSAAFLAIGLSAFILLLVLFEVAFKNDNIVTTPIERVSEFTSRNALGFFILHIIVLLGAKIVVEDVQGNVFSTNNTFLIYGITLLILVFSGLFLIIKKQTVDAFFRWTPIDFDLTILRFVMISLFIFAIGFGFNRELEVIAQSRAEIDSYILGRSIVKSTEGVWYDDEYVGRSEINTDIDNILNKDNWIFIVVNHSELVSKGDSFYADGSDLKIVDSKSQSIPVLIENPNSSSTKILFKVESNPDVKYFLYFGNEFAEATSVITDTSNSNLAEKRELAKFEYKPLQISLNKNWYLKGFKNSEEYERMTFEFAQPIASDLIVNYEIINKENNLVNSGVLDSKDVESKKIILDTSTLPVGQYFLQLNTVSFEDTLEILQSKKYRFYTSYPLFVNWSIDWEGFGVNQVDLTSISSISSTYNTPITHYFNPVIFIPDVIAPNEANYYKNWVLERQRVNDDEIGLHNHLTPRLLQEVGVDVNQDAKIVGIGRDETALSGYSYEELDKIIGWSVDKFEEVGLGTPKSYRAGAWLTSSNLLQVLNDQGFVYDSSGRTGGFLTRTSGSSAIPWNLDPTTKPYRPNVSDINSPDAPNLNLFEFPNNGADSYWFSLEELKDRFNKNYSETMESAQVLTYLSHPHGFDFYDSAKIKGLFDYISAYKYENDNGPIVQTTLKNVYTEFNLSNF